MHLGAQAARAQTPVFINEIHYDNIGADQGEAVEIAAPAGTDLTGWSLALYNGNASQRNVYTTIDLSGIVPDQCNGFGTLAFARRGIQNGAPDGLALVDQSGAVVQFLSYEGSFTAASGPAAGMTSLDIGVQEDSSTPAGHSLQLTGSGITFEDFSWQAAALNTFDKCNTGQIFLPATTATARFSQALYEYNEDGTAVGAQVEVTRTGNLTGPSTVEVRFREGSASGGVLPLGAGEDYDSTRQTVHFVSGQSRAGVRVPLNDDGQTEGPEDFTLALTPVAGADIGSPDSATVVILDNEARRLAVINEILADPALSPDGDANGDSIRNGSDDEFVEIVNVSGDSLDLSGWTLSDGLRVRHTFPDNTVLPDGCAIVLFGGGSPDGTFGGAEVQTASTGLLALNNSGDTIVLNDGASDMASLTYGPEASSDQSLTRDPDITGSVPLAQHSTATGAGGALFSPGTRVDGTRFAACFSSSDITEIFEIQGDGATSPLIGEVVATEDNIVTAVAPNGFFVQTPPERSDTDPRTSNGIFVFTGGPPPATVGDRVDFSGEVAEFFGFTQLTNVTELTVRASGAPLPPPVTLNADTPSPDQPQPVPDLERFEGMLVEIAAGLVSGPNQQFSSDRVAEVHIVASRNRPFREPGIEFPGLSGLPLWDGNPEVFELDPDRLGQPNLRINAGSTFQATGVVGFEFGGYELWPTALAVEQAPLPRPVRARQQGESTIGTLNLLRLFETDGNFQDRLTKLSRFIREVLRAPDVLAVQEVENLSTLHALAQKIHADDSALSYTAHLVEGNRDIDVGFLTRTVVQVDSVVQKGKNERFSFDGSLLHDRPPLLLFARLPGERRIVVLNLHLRSRRGIDTSDSTRVRRKRHAQAVSVSKLIAGLQAAEPDIKLVVAGDFNAFHFTDGYVHVLGQIMGAPADESQAQRPGTDEFDPDLTNEIFRLPAGERYSFVFRGNAQTLDHLLTSQALHPFVSGMEIARGNADAASILFDDTATPLRASDHDGLVLYLTQQPEHNLNHLLRPEAANVVFDDATHQFKFDVRFENISAQALFAPFSVEILHLAPSPPAVTIDNADNGQTGATARFDYSALLGSDGTLTPGEKTGFKTWIFNDSSQVDFTVSVNAFGQLSSAPARAPASRLDSKHEPFVFFADVDNGTVDVVTHVETLEPPGMPAQSFLQQNYPNPFNPQTTIQYDLPRSSPVKLEIYNLIGQLIRVLVRGRQPAGFHAVSWDGKDTSGAPLASGIYLYKLEAAHYRSVRKLMLLR
ncbi:MAG: lamin tail domain-containing protein [bacterium]